MADPGGFHEAPMADASQSPSGPLPAFGATVTILFSDIRGFTEYTNQYGDDAAIRVLRRHSAIVHQQLEVFGGHVVKTQGDNFMVSFTTARGAILCAVTIQRAIAAATQDQTGTRIAVGIGINTGEALEEAGDFFGNAVNLAARICAAAGPGQIFISETTRFVAGKVETIEYVDHGPHELKGFQEPQRIFEVSWAPGAERAEGAVTPGAEDPELVLAIQRALGTLSRVLAISHKDNPTFRPLIECQAKASELRLKLSRAVAEPRGYTLERIQEAIAPFTDLLTLIVDRDRLDDQRWAHAEGVVSRTFGRPLTTAAARGHLVIEGSELRAAPAAVPVAPVAAARRHEPRPPAPPPILPPPDARAAGVVWWSAAHAGWNTWKRTDMALAHAVRAALTKHPYLLSVPIQESAGHDGGRLASGYFLLLEHVEHLMPGFIGTAVNRAVADAGGSLEPAVLGPELYRLLVSTGRLEETYAGFVRDVMTTAIPNPGVWADGGLIEDEDATVLVARPSSTPGEPVEHAQSVAEPRDRVAARRFGVTVAPLTTRFFFVKTGTLKSPRDVVLWLTQNGQPSDLAWYLTIRTGHILHSDARRVSAKGTLVSGLSRDYGALWTAVFNPDPEQPVPCELSIRVQGPGEPVMRSSTFTRLDRGPR